MYATLHASERAVEAARRLAAPTATAIGVEALTGLLDQVCAEAGAYDSQIAARAVGQAGGDVARAVTLVRVWAATLLAVEPLPLRPGDVRLHRRVSAAFAEVPAGQWLGRSSQFGSRLLTWSDDQPGGAPVDGSADGDAPVNGKPRPAPGDEATAPPSPRRADCPRVADLLSDIPVRPVALEPDGPDPAERPLTLPASRGARLAALARGETGALVALASLDHGRRREEVLLEATSATAELHLAHPRTGAPVRVADVPFATAEVVTDAEVDGRPGVALGFGASLGHLERRAIAIAILDGGIQAGGEGGLTEGSLLAAVDGLATSGFVEHLCLSHHASFGAYLARVDAPDDEDEG